MELTNEQVGQYWDQGFLQVGQLFTRDEVDLMRSQLPGIYAEDSPARVLEADTDFTAAVGQDMVDHFIAIKRKEWNDYLDHTTDWELDTYLEFI